MAEVILQAGAGKAEIPFAREDFPLKAFTGIHDRIYVRVLMLKAEISLALVSIELTSLPPQAIRRFQQACSMATGIPEENVLVSVTHTFSAPHIPPHIKNEQEQRLSDIMYERILTAIRQASEEARKSVIEASVTYCETSCRLNVNRNVDTPEGFWLGCNEEAYSDHTIRVLEFRHGEELFAYLMNYDIQASVMDKSESVSGGRLISGDLAGAASRELERTTGVTAMFLPGCAGDQAPLLQAVRADADGNVTDLHEDGFVLSDQMGNYLAQRVREAKKIAGPDISGGTEVPVLRMVTETAELPEQVMKYPTKELRPHKQYSFELTGQKVQVPVTVIYVGPVRLLMTTPELNSRFGAKIRRAAGKEMLIGTLVNGAVKYLPEAEDFECITYEAMNSSLGPGSDDRFFAAVLRLKDSV